MLTENKNPLVSIIIPVYNRVAYLLETLKSLVEQSYSNWECILVDDFSTEDSISIIENFIQNENRFLLIKKNKILNKGANASRNIGLNQANGEFIIFFDSDDIMAKTMIENRINHFKQYPDFDFLVFSMGFFLESQNLQVTQNRKSINLDNEKTIEEFVFSNLLPWNVCRPIYKTQLIKNKINFDERIHNFQDDEFAIRLLKNFNPKYKSIDITDCYYRSDEKSKNKYQDDIGKQNIIDALPILFQTISNALSENTKRAKKHLIIKKIVENFPSKIKRKTNLKPAINTIKIAKNNFYITKKEYYTLLFLVLFEKYYPFKKGWHSVHKKIKKILF